MTHQFKVGDDVIVKIYDWTSQSVTKKVVKGRVLACILEPIGYDVELLESVQFTGYIPSTMSSKTVTKINKDSVQCRSLFVRDFCVSPQTSELKTKMQNFLQGLIFKKVSAVHCKPEKPDYINVFTADGKITTVLADQDIFKYLSVDERPNRLAYKYQHFFGFTSNDTILTTAIIKNPPSIYFSNNQFCKLDFQNGAHLIEEKDPLVFKPQVDYLICGRISVSQDKQPRYDQWFIASEQFKNFCMYLNLAVPSQDEIPSIISKLVIPVNQNNFYIPHESYISRYIYAALYSLIVLGQTRLPTEWNLPVKYINGVSVPFEEWWPTAFRNN